MKIGDKREKIIQSAINVFAEKGFYEAKISEIADSAGVADGTIYLYFKNKNDILLAIFEEQLAKIFRKINQQLIATDDPLEKLKAFTSQYLKMLIENKHLALLLQTELKRNIDFLVEYNEQKFSEYLNLIHDIIIDGQKNGVFNSELDAGIVVSAIYGAMDEVARVYHLMDRKDPNHDTLINHFNNLFINGLLKKVSINT